MYLPLYLFNRLVYRIFEFIKHWYLDGSRLYFHIVISLLEKIDRTIAFKITLRYIFMPLYQDFSILGYILGFIFRFIRLFMGAIIYSILIFLALSIYLAWVVAPLYIISQIIFNVIKR